MEGGFQQRSEGFFDIVDLVVEEVDHVHYLVGVHGCEEVGGLGVELVVDAVDADGDGG